MELNFSVNQHLNVKHAIGLKVENLISFAQPQFKNFSTHNNKLWCEAQQILPPAAT